jgi:hypothetical protein
MISDGNTVVRKKLHYDGTRVDSLTYLIPYLKNCRNLLDFGCGSGNLLKLCAQHNITASGYDNNPDAISICRKRGFKCYDELPNLAEFDGLTMICVSEHLQPEFLWKILSSFKGTIALQCDEPRVIFTPWRFTKTSFWDDFEHVRPYTPIALRAMLECYDFTISAAGWVKPQSTIKNIPSWIANKYLDCYAILTGARSTHYAVGVK